MPTFDEAPVQLTVHSEHSHVRLVRLLVSSLASDLGADVDEIEDLRIAADELVSLAIGVSPGGSVRIGLAPTDGTLTMEVDAAILGPGAPRRFDPLAESIMTFAVASWEVGTHDGRLFGRWTSRKVTSRRGAGSP